MPTPPSGQISIATINANFGRGTNLNAYRGTIWYQPNSLVFGYFPSGAISLSNFYNKQPNDPATSGAANYTSPGSYGFVVPLYRNYLRVQLWGAGGGGGSGLGGNGGAGGASTFGGVAAYGGGGGSSTSISAPRSIGSPGAGGGAAGGNEANLSGASGSSYNGGAGANGGAGGAGNIGVNTAGNPGGYPGGGGGGGQNDDFRGNWWIGGGGGGGGYCQYVWGPGLTAGATLTAVVGAGGAGGAPSYGGGGGAGANGRVYITWG